MRLSEALDAIEQIHAATGDPEVARSREGDLYALFVQHVAENGPSDLRDIAKALLMAREADFPRLP